MNENEKNYTFRKLTSQDIFPMVKIISKIGVNELSEVFDSNKIKELADANRGQENANFTVGVGVMLEIANKLLENLPKCEKEIYSLLASATDMKVDDIKNLDMDVFLEMVIEFVMKDEFKNFFKVASKYIKA